MPHASCLTPQAAEEDRRILEENLPGFDLNTVTRGERQPTFETMPYEELDTNFENMLMCTLLGLTDTGLGGI